MIVPVCVLLLVHIFESSKVSIMQDNISGATISALEAKAEVISETLAALANPKRLVVLCTLLRGERSVGDLAEIVQLTPAALSQHLGKMRALRMVGTRRHGQTIYYSLASDEVRSILEALYETYCGPDC